MSLTLFLPCREFLHCSRIYVHCMNILARFVLFIIIFVFLLSYLVLFVDLLGSTNKLLFRLCSLHDFASNTANANKKRKEKFNQFVILLN